MTYARLYLHSWICTEALGSSSLLWCYSAPPGNTRATAPPMQHCHLLAVPPPSVLEMQGGVHTDLHHGRGTERGRTEKGAWLLRHSGVLTLRPFKTGRHTFEMRVCVVRNQNSNVLYAHTRLPAPVFVCMWLHSFNRNEAVNSYGFDTTYYRAKQHKIHY